MRYDWEGSNEGLKFDCAADLAEKECGNYTNIKEATMNFSLPSYLSFQLFNYGTIPPYLPRGSEVTVLACMPQH